MAKVWTTVDQLANPTHPLAQEVIESASWILFKLTAEKYPGINTSTEIYSTRDFTAQVAPVLIQGKLVNLPVGTSMGNRRELYLRHKPIRRLISVKINGIEQPLTNYEVRNYSYLIKKDRTFWNFHANYEVEVSYEWGSNPPRIGVEAAIKLANELILAIENDPACAIPANVTSVSRQGMEFQMTDPQIFIEQGRTGIREVDLFIIAANPSKSRKQSRLFSPTRIIGETRL